MSLKLLPLFLIPYDISVAALYSQGLCIFSNSNATHSDTTLLIGPQPGCHLYNFQQVCGAFVVYWGSFCNCIH